MAPSTESKALAELFTTLAKKFPSDGDPYLSRCVYDRVHEAAAEAPGVSYEDVVVAGRPAKWVRPENCAKDRVILFMHGGGYTFGSPNGHRKLAAHLAKSCNALALSVDYRLTPEVAYPVPLDDCVAAYKWLLDSGFKSTHIVTAGDSCGGGLSTAVPLAAAKRGLPQPACAVSLSPWYDLTGGGDSRAENAENDVLNTADFVEVLAQRYTAGGASRENPLISPLFADLAGLCPHWVSCGGFDMLRDDGVRFAEEAKKAGVEVVLEVHEAQQHVMEFMAGKAPEADKSLRDIGEWVRKKIGS